MRRRYLVVGSVQGVGFRYFARRQALRLGLRGWVRNLPDGRVEAFAQGDPDALTQLEAELRRGPALASVTEVRSEDLPEGGENLGSFEIR